MFKWQSLSVTTTSMDLLDDLVASLMKNKNVRNVHVYGLKVVYQQKTWVQEDEQE